MTILQSTNTAMNQGVKSIVHGSPKIGKTSLAATCPKPIIMSSEKGLLSLRKYNIPVYDMSTPKSFRDGMHWIKSSNEVRQFQTILWDSVTESAEILLRSTHKKDARQAYGEMQDEIAGHMRDLRDLSGPHIVFIMQSEFYKDDALGTAVWVPTIPGQSLKSKIGYLPDEIFFMYSATNPADGKEYRALRCQPDFRTVAGDRSGALAAVEPPDLGAIFAKIAAQ